MLNNPKRLALFMIFIFSLVMLAFVFFTTDLFIVPLLEGKFFKKVSMPDITGLDSAAAFAELTGKGLTVGEISHAYNKSVARGKVMYQIPFPGYIVKKKRRIKFMVSLGEEMISVPELKELSPSQASDTLQKLGLRLGEAKEVYNAGRTPGTIVRSVPRAGMRIPGGSAVDIVISQNSLTGKTYVPDFVNLSLGEAKVMIEKYQLVLRKTVYRKASELVPGTILEQSIKAGSDVDQGTYIDFTVSE